MILKLLVDASRAIEHLCNSREIEGEVAYDLHKSYRVYREIMADLGAFEKNVIAELELETRGNQLVFPGQDPKKLGEYMVRRNKFIEEKEVEIEFPKFTFKKLKSAGLSSNDIMALEDIGVLDDGREDSE